MTTVAPPPAPAAEHREHRGWHIPTWAATTVGVILLVVAALGVLRAVRLHRDRVGRGFGRIGGNIGNGHVHWVLWIVVILAAAGGIALLVAASRSRRTGAAATATPLVPATPVGAAAAEQILAERFARGEIDEAEFVARRDALRR
jgi:putative membrane protein